MSKRPTTTRQYIRHGEHSHEQTKSANAKCRALIERTGQPWDGDEETLAVNQKAAAAKAKAATTRAKRRAQRAQVQTVDAIVGATDRMRMSLNEWRTLITHLETAEEYLTQEHATLKHVHMEVVVNETTFDARFLPAEGWTVGVAG